jgi:outer membrane lipoprotein-sorting protein
MGSLVLYTLGGVMRISFFAAVGVGLVFATSDVRADGQADALKIIEKAIKATGDEAKLAKLTGTTYKMKGTFHGMGAEMPYSGEAAMQLPDKSRMALEFDVGGQKFNFVMVFSGDKGWMKANDMNIEMDADRVAEQKENMHMNQVARLVGLKDKAYTLAPLGDSKIENQNVVGVKVSTKGRRDINLYFDKETGLLAKSDMRVKDDAGQEVNQESFYKDYKTTDGIKHPTKVTIKRDGQLYIEGENTDWKPVEKLDDKLFAEP